MILDCHVHIMEGPPDPEGFCRRLRDAGAGGALVISLAPRCFSLWADQHTSRERLDNLFEWTRGSPRLYPFFWIDPTEEDALEQVDLAVERGVRGFKCICGHFYPRDDRAMAVFRAIADSDKPLLFHSGILFDGQDSSRYNRPTEFEAMLGIPRLKFALAHISWPWCDELIAVYGKFQAAAKHRPGDVPEMFIDTTPGTPAIYREEALKKLFTVGYDVTSKVVFGSDQKTNDYKADNVKKLIERDIEILTSLGVDGRIIDNVLGGNLERFLGVC